MIDIKNKKVDDVTNNLTSQSLVIKSLSKESTTHDTKHWQSTKKSLPKNIFSFVNHYINNTLQTSKNMVLRYTLTPQHVVSGNKAALNKRRYNWRHDSILANLMKELKNLLNKQLVLYADVADYKLPTIITGPSQRPDTVTVDVNK